MKIIVRSRCDAQDFKSETPWACISITNPGYEFAILNRKNLVDLLQLRFSDVDMVREEPGTSDEELAELGFKLFSKQDAEKILKFAESVKDKAGTLLVHCEMGISRSAATAAALSKIYYGNDFKFFRPPYVPNMFIYRTILNQHYSPA